MGPSMSILLSLQSLRSRILERHEFCLGVIKIDHLAILLISGGKPASYPEHLSYNDVE